MSEVCTTFPKMRIKNAALNQMWDDTIKYSIENPISTFATIDWDAETIKVHELGSVCSWDVLGMTSSLSTNYRMVLGTSYEKWIGFANSAYYGTAEWNAAGMVRFLGSAYYGGSVLGSYAAMTFQNYSDPTLSGTVYATPIAALDSDGRPQVGVIISKTANFDESGKMEVVVGGGSPTSTFNANIGKWFDSLELEHIDEPKHNPVAILMGFQLGTAIRRMRK